MTNETLPHAELDEVPGAGHMAPALGPQRLADELIPFFEAGLEPA